MLPIRRDYRFKLPAARARDWHYRGHDVTQFFNALSVFFPVGERFFISSIRRFRGRAKDEELKAAVSAFIGQEAMHGREHEAFNAMLVAQGLPAHQLERGVSVFLRSIQALTPAAWQLSVTIALEHFTATFASRLLEDRALLDGAEPEFRRLWLWHALEETEHKAVAFDLWKDVMGEGWDEYAVRVAGMAVTSIVFALLVGAFTGVMVESDLRRLGSRSRWTHYRTLLSFLYGPGGFLAQSSRELLDYFRKDFHPWQHDNERMLERLQELGAPGVPAAIAQAA